MGSRVGSSPIDLPAGVEVKISDRVIHVRGPKGELSHTLHEAVNVLEEDKKLICQAKNDESTANKFVGTTRAVLNNKVIGVTEGFSKKLQLIGVGYRVQVGKSKEGLAKAEFTLGKSHPDIFMAPKGIEFVSPSATEIEVKGTDKVLVGQVAANIRMLRPPEPYKGKGIRYVGETIILKEVKK